jgi:hypothetical protein
MSTTIFDLNHIFIVFGIGSSGNFIAGVLDKLTKKDLTRLPISSTGSSHTVLTDKKRTGGDSLSFGTIPDEHIEFESVEVREQYYLSKIQEEYKNVNSPQITWTHDYTNIPIYKKYFKHSRILTITHDSYESRLTSVCMHVTKVLFDPNIVLPIREPYLSHHLFKWKHTCISEMTNNVGIDLAEDIFNKHTTQEYANHILKYFGLRLIIKTFGLFGFAEEIETNERCLYDYALYPNKDKIPPYTVGENNYDYVKESDAILSYSYLINNQPNMLIESIEKIFQRHLSEEEQNFVLTEYKMYRQAQNKDILKNPVKYYRDVKELAETHIKDILK